MAAERDVCCYGKHVSTVGVFSSLEKQGHKLHKEDGGDLRKDGRQTDPEVSIVGIRPGVCDSVYLCLFPTSEHTSVTRESPDPTPCKYQIALETRLRIQGPP